MFDILNIIFLGATITSQAVNIVGRSDAEISKQEGIRVYAVNLTQQAPLWSDLCHYKGVMVEYSRDWVEKNKNGDIVLPPEPEKPIGYALILNKEKCPKQEERTIFSTGSKYFYPLFGKGYVIREGHRMDAVDYASQSEWLRPKWMPQVLRTLNDEANVNPVAKHFLEELEQSAINNKTLTKDGVTGKLPPD